jgi:hypothetical protein
VTSPQRPIRTVSGPGLTLSQGPVVDAHPETHGTLAVRTGPHTIATGRPVPSIRGNDA